ncbi:MAG: hypothetical protein HEQ13_10170 [Dolichospermum sp. DEX189]|jgi:hypothetical protein|nr:hypothetical protein [Dolichospermum sp. DEX189]
MNLSKKDVLEGVVWVAIFVDTVNTLSRLALKIVVMARQKARGKRQE